MLCRICGTTQLQTTGLTSEKENKENKENPLKVQINPV